MNLLRLGISQRPAANKVGVASNALVRNLFVAFLLTTYATAQAATINAASGSAADVQTALNSASAGDTVAIPAGSNRWATAVSWSAPANVTVQGAGTSATGGGDQTIIVDDVANGSPLLQLSVAATGTFRLAGITFQSGTGAIKDGGTIQIGGGGTVRLDHLHFVMTSSANYKTLYIGGGVRGVLDHSILDLAGLNAIYVYNGRSGAGEAQGNYEWTQPTAFGSADFFFVEDNIVNGNVGGGAYSTRVWDGFTAAKVVVRFNTLSQSCISETHATGHAPNDRGTRAQEAYGNAITSSLTFEPNYVMTDLSSGGGLVWGNSANNVFKNMFTLRVTRANNGTYGQSATPTGWGYAGTNFNGTGSMWDGGTAYGTNLGTGYPALDQPGRGAGDLLHRDLPNKTNSTTGTIFWPHQALEPIYLWQNAGNIVSGWGGSYFAVDGNYAAANRDYYPQASSIQTSPTSPFDGTSGTGWGTLENRPTTCTAGVAYWATDQGSWNTSSTNVYGVQQNGADGVLYKATAANTWTLYYTPYTYPHPLVNGGAPELRPLQPSPPTGLRKL